MIIIVYYYTSFHFLNHFLSHLHTSHIRQTNGLHLTRGQAEAQRGHRSCRATQPVKGKARNSSQTRRNPKPSSPTFTHNSSRSWQGQCLPNTSTVPLSVCKVGRDTVIVCPASCFPLFLGKLSFPRTQGLRPCSSSLPLVVDNEPHTRQWSHTL